MAVPQFKDFSVRLDGSVAILAYDRQATGNSLHPDVIQSLLGATKWAVANPDVKVIVQTGEGKFFSTGRDMSGAGDVDIDRMLEIFKDLNEVLIKCPKLLIAAVNGPAVGYGVTSLALYDLVYSVPDAYFFTPFSKWALCPEGCSSVTFTAIMGHQKAMALLLAGERMSAEELWVAGMITKIIPAKSNEEFLAAVMEVAHRVAAYPPTALAASKRLCSGDREKVLLEANERECKGLRERIEHPEIAEALLGFAREQKQKKLARQGKL